MNVQLYAYENGTRYQLDLYEENPIKITLSAEEITDPTIVNSSFSRQFRIPATSANSQFFKYWYTSGVIDFDVTKKVTSEIHVDGILYTAGQLRLVAAYNNGSDDRIDFEVVFLGETKTFSSQVGDGYMNSLDVVDAAHVLSLSYLENSWLEPWNATQSYVVDEWVWHSTAGGNSYKCLVNNTNSEPTLTNNDWQRMTTIQRVPNPEPIRYILANRGYSYDEDGGLLAVPGANATSEVAVDGSAVGGAGTHNASFTKSVHPLYLTQFTPIVQVKYLIDKIFAQTSYKYTLDSVFNEDWFKDLYIDGIATGFPFTPNGDGLSNASTLAQQNIEDLINIVFPFVQQNNANAYDSNTGFYTCPVAGSYSFEVELFGRIDGTSQQDDPEIRLSLYRNGSEVAHDIQGGLDPLIYDFTLNNKLTYSGNFNAGDVVNVVTLVSFGEGHITNGRFACTASPAQIAVNDLLKNDLKIIDWFKSILTKFRLVMVPNVNNPNQFTIKPWEEYIASGDTFDWTYKLDHSKDIKMEPLFYSQEADITFTDKEDIDVTNKYQQDTFGIVYGTRLFTSGNELLSNTKEITTEFAPTPVSEIEGLFQFETDFIIPRFYENGDLVTDHGHLTHEPIVPVQRLLFWNGLQPTSTVEQTGGGATVQVTWYYTDNTTTKDSDEQPLLFAGQRRYPRASYLQEIPTLNTTLNLNWRKSYPYFAYPGAPSDIGQNGQDVYTRYWKSYIDNVYSPRARKMTAYFNLGQEDMRRLTFDDLIWIKDTYWRIQKVYDAPLGEVATVKVELVKLLDYVRPIAVLDAGDVGVEIEVGEDGGSNSAFYGRQENIWSQQVAERSPGGEPTDDAGQPIP